MAVIVKPAVDRELGLAVIFAYHRRAVRPAGKEEFARTCICDRVQAYQASLLHQPHIGGAIDGLIVTVLLVQVIAIVKGAGAVCSGAYLGAGDIFQHAYRLRDLPTFLFSGFSLRGKYLHHVIPLGRGQLQ